MSKTVQITLKGSTERGNPFRAKRSPLFEGGRSIQDRGGGQKSPSLDISALSRHPKNWRHVCNRDFLTIQCLKCGHVRQIRAGSRDRTCPACQRSVYEKIFQKYRQVLGRYGNLKFLTLTWKPVKTQDPEIVREIGRCLTRLLHREIFRNVRGLIATVECKKNRSGMFYYHVHCIFSGPNIPQKWISRAWSEVSGFPIVYIKKITRTRNRALRYVLKYVLKGMSFEDPDDREDFKTSMKGVRFIRSYREFYNAEYRSGRHVYFPCPECGSVKSWVVMDFVDTVDLPRGIPYCSELPDG